MIYFDIHFDLVRYTFDSISIPFDAHPYKQLKFNNENVRFISILISMIFWYLFWCISICFQYKFNSNAFMKFDTISMYYFDMCSMMLVKFVIVNVFVRFYEFSYYAALSSIILCFPVFQRLKMHLKIEKLKFWVDLGGFLTNPQ